MKGKSLAGGLQHTAKAAASSTALGRPFRHGRCLWRSADHVSGIGRRPQQAGCPFRENAIVIRKVMSEEFPNPSSSYGEMFGTVDLVPNPIGKLPILVRTTCRKTLEWIAKHGGGWITNPWPIQRQA
jgi:alkanesulfonate monooxygenase SsuD/methylene tetrahydromethanopterin reductase-like flavin-dependent oxidoreductase (luciferase family)